MQRKKLPVSVTIERHQLAMLDADERISILGRSGIIRELLFEHYQKRELEDGTKNEETQKGK